MEANRYYGLYNSIEAGLSEATSGQTVIAVSGTHAINNSVSIPSGICLWLQPDVTLNVVPGASINVVGSLVGWGSSSHPVLFTNQSQSYWPGIFLSGSDGSCLWHCNIYYASSPIVATNSTNLSILNCTIGNSNFGYDAAMRFYNTSPNISECVINGQGDSWNGVRFAQGSGGGIYNSTIQNCSAGNGIVVHGGSSPVIQGNTIYHNYYDGIIVPNNGSGFPWIYNNNISYNGQYSYLGMSFDGSQGEVNGNNVSYSAGGIYAVNSAFLRTSDYSTYLQEGNNIIHNTNLALLSQWYSTVCFGYVIQDWDVRLSYGACNQFYSNGVNAENDYWSTLQAEGNWWGDYPPDPNKMSHCLADDVDYNYWKYGSDDPCDPIFERGGQIMSQNSEGSSRPEDAFKQATKALVQKDYSNAATQFRSLVKSNLNTSDRERALVGIYHVLRASKDMSYLNDIIQQKSSGGSIGKIASQLLASSYLVSGDLENAKQVANEIITRNPNSEDEMRALMILACLSGYNSSQSSVSQAAVQQLKLKYGSKVGGDFFAALGTPPTNTIKASSGTDKGGVLSCYPNPFNPTTRIQFKVATPSHVSLRVFDILGREVATLVNEQKNAGVFAADWDGSKFSSGTYIVKLSVGDKSFLQKVMLLK